MTNSTSQTIILPSEYSNRNIPFSLGKLNNENNFVAGAWGSGSAKSSSFLYKDGNYIAQSYPGSVGTVASGLNDSGQVVGSYVADQENGTTSGYVYDGSKYTALNVPNATSSSAGDINNSGAIVGSYSDKNGASHGYVYNNGTYTTVDAPGAKTTNLSGLNDKGQAVGSYSTDNKSFSGLLYTNGGTQTLNYPGATSTYLNDINNDGTAVGIATGLSGSNNSAGMVGFTYKDGVFTPVKGATNVTGINDRGQLLTDTQDVQTQVRKVSISDPANPLCFVTGTLIRTTRGDVPVEALAVGDVAVTATGVRRPIRWLGRRSLDCAAAPRPSAVWPVRVRAGAFSPGLPARDLRLSPGHPVLIGADVDGRGGVLVPIMCLINGTTIAREATAAVTYWHVELDAHDLLLAEGFPAESYYDMGSRPWFAGADGPLIDPDFVPAGENGRCRPVAVDGPLVEAERARLSAVFAATLGAQCGWDETERFAWIVA